MVEKTHPTVQLSGDVTLTIRGPTWTIEFEPGNCSDRITKIELVFEKHRVARVTQSRGPSTGKICDW